ncbi:MAG: undecaprenyl-phosphate glucose phosphotransferase [Phototrophicales bacterium]|nr:undecaprenyl-phosphate glucose phosphotransferase [Phototrophicales bacterium]
MAGNTSFIPPNPQQLIKTKAENGRSNRIKASLEAVLFFLDIISLCMAFILAYVARLYVPLFNLPDELAPMSEFLPLMVLQIFVIVIVFYFSRLYHQRRVTSRIDHARNILGAVTIGMVLASGIQELIFRNTALDVDYSRTMFFYNWVLTVILVVAGREAHRILKVSFRRRGVVRDNLLLIGTGRVVRDISHRIKHNPDLGYQIVGVVTDVVKPKGKINDMPILGLYHDLPVIIDHYGVEQVIIALPDARRADIVELVTLCQRGRVDIKIFPDIFAYMAGDLNVDDLGGTPLLTVRDIALRGWKLSLKRGLDIFGALFGLIFLSPMLLLIAIIVRLESPGAPFYSQIRMGLDGRPFPIIKFRSMRKDAESKGVGWTIQNDPRITKVGKILRKTELDELPQLINVLLGHMSLVGPRPERPQYVQQFRQKIPRYMERHREKAGMTGWAQVNGLRGDTSIEERTSFDLWYVENWSLWLDIKIIIRTVLQAILRINRNAY